MILIDLFGPTNIMICLTTRARIHIHLQQQPPHTFKLFSWNKCTLPTNENLLSFFFFLCFLRPHLHRTSSVWPTKENILLILAGPHWMLLAVCRKFHLAALVDAEADPVGLPARFGANLIAFHRVVVVVLVVVVARAFSSTSSDQVELVAFVCKKTDNNNNDGDDGQLLAGIGNQTASAKKARL